MIAYFKGRPCLPFFRREENKIINSINVPAQAVAVQANVLFATDRVRSSRGDACCGGWLFHDLGSGQFTLVNDSSCGCKVFEVQFNANVSSATTGALAFVIQANGEAVGGTEMDYTVATANAFGNISSSTLIKVPAGASVTVTVKNISLLPANVKDANIIIKKIA